MADHLYLQDDGLTLKNRLGIQHDPGRLSRAEASRTAYRQAQLVRDGLPDAQGVDLLKAVHHHLFQDVYDWAGKFRTTPLEKEDFVGGARTVFTPPHLIERDAKALFDRFAQEGAFQGLSPAAITDRLADRFAALNALHPFREGNGRTQRIILSDMARKDGVDLSFEGLSKERMASVSIAAARGDLDPARRMFDELLDPARHRDLVHATRGLENYRRAAEQRSEKGVFDWRDRYIATTTPGQAYAGQFAGRRGDTFLLGTHGRIFVGRIADLPNKGAGIQSGDTVSFTATATSSTERHSYWDKVRAAGAGRTASKSDVSETIRKGPRPK